MAARHHLLPPAFLQEAFGIGVPTIQRKALPKTPLGIIIGGTSKVVAVVLPTHQHFAGRSVSQKDGFPVDMVYRTQKACEDQKS